MLDSPLEFHKRETTTSSSSKDKNATGEQSALRAPSRAPASPACGACCRTPVRHPLSPARRLRRAAFADVALDWQPKRDTVSPLPLAPLATTFVSTRDATTTLTVRRDSSTVAMRRLQPPTRGSALATVNTCWRVAIVVQLSRFLFCAI